MRKSYMQGPSQTACTTLQSVFSQRGRRSFASLLTPLECFMAFIFYLLLSSLASRQLRMRTRAWRLRPPPPCHSSPIPPSKLAISHRHHRAWSSLSPWPLFIPKMEACHCHHTLLIDAVAGNGLACGLGPT